MGRIPFRSHRSQGGHIAISRARVSNSMQDVQLSALNQACKETNLLSRSVKEPPLPVGYLPCRHRLHAPFDFSFRFAGLIKQILTLGHSLRHHDYLRYHPLPFLLSLLQRSDRHRTTSETCRINVLPRTFKSKRMT